MAELKYDSKFLTDSQDELARNVIKSCISGFELESPPKSVIYGLNFSEEIQKLEMMKEGCSKKELKKINKEIKLKKVKYGDRIKIVFKINSILPKLIYRNIRTSPKVGFTDVSTWTGFLDFPISEPFIYGRACLFERHKGGSYLFAPFFGQNDQLRKVINKMIEKFPEIPLNDIIEHNTIISFLFAYCNSEELKNILEIGRLNFKSRGLPDYPLVDDLNKNKNLKHLMRKILHFGAVYKGNIRCVSKNDVSTIFIPYKNATIFQVSNYLWDYKKPCKAINCLVKNLQKYR